MKNLKILMVIAVFYPYIGGAEKQAQKLAHHLLRKDVEIAVVTGRWSSALEKTEDIDGIKVIRNFGNFGIRRNKKTDFGKSYFYTELPDKRLRLKYIRAIIRKILVRISVYIYQTSLFFFLIRSRKKYDIIHVHQVLYPAYISTLCGKILKKHVIAKVGSSGFNSDINQLKKFPEGKLQLRYILRNIDRIVCTSRKIVEEFGNEGIKKSKLALIHNGVEVGYFIRSYDSCTSFITMGRLIKSKNIETLLTAFSEIVRNLNENLKLTIIGDGPERNNIINLIDVLNLKDNVILTGMLDNPQEYLKKSDVFVFPTIIEGLSNSLIEAMSFKLPCIISNIPGNLEVIGYGGNEEEQEKFEYEIEKGKFVVKDCAVLFNPTDSEGLASAMKYILMNSDIREKLGKNAYNQVNKEFNIDSVSESYISLYNEVLGK